MSVAGFKKGEWVAQTLCDFGQPGRVHVIRDHYSVDSAVRAFKNLAKIYGNKLKGERCWQETREGEVINDSNVGC